MTVTYVIRRITSGSNGCPWLRQRPPLNSADKALAIEVTPSNNEQDKKVIEKIRKHRNFYKYKYFKRKVEFGMTDIVVQELLQTESSYSQNLNFLNLNILQRKNNRKGSKMDNEWEQKLGESLKTIQTTSCWELFDFFNQVEKNFNNSAWDEAAKKCNFRELKKRHFH